MVKDNDNGVVEFQFHKRDDSSNWQNFKKALYDPTTKRYLGRTPKSWGQILFFYLIFYIVLAALFSICMQGLFATLSENEPKWKLDSSLIGINPGLGFRPISDKTEEGSLIWYNITDRSSSDKWVKLIDEFLEPYKKVQLGDNYVNCDFNQPPPEGKTCTTQIKDFGNCTPENEYGYNTTSPCIFLKLNRIYDWQPQFYTEPLDEMPQELKNHIMNIKNETEKNQIWVSCEGEDDADKDNIQEFEYSPKGFAGYYYPYKNTRNYLSPLIAVKVKNPKPNVIIGIECRAWAKNIIYRGGSLNRAGSVSFEIMVDMDHQTSVKLAQVKPTSDSM